MLGGTPMNKKSKFGILATSAVLSTTILLTGNPDKVSANGTKMSSSSYMQLQNVVQKYKVPQNVTEIIGIEGKPYPHFYNNRHKIYKKNNLNGLIYGRDMPFYLKDNATGIMYPGYCAQSWVLASKDMSATGLATDPRLLKLANIATKGDVASPAHHDHVAMQTVLWAALNNNWSPDLFGKHISTDRADYPQMQQVYDSIMRVSAEWGDIIGTKEAVKPVINKSEEYKAKPPLEDDSKTTIVAVEIALEGGAALPYDLSKIANITHHVPGDWSKLDRKAAAAEIQAHGLPLSIKYEYFKVPVTDKEQRVKVKADVKYVENYKVLNDIALAVYTGSSGNQPFLMPRNAIKNFEYTVIIPPGKCGPSDPNYENGCKPPEEEKEPEGDIEVIPLRWHNMPLAFGEMKDGIGHNNLGITDSGTYAKTRDKEEFEAMNGVPTTERFYVNLGGTEGFIDVKYNYVKVKQDFQVKWKSVYHAVPKVCGQITTPFDHTNNWVFKAMNIQEASFRVFNHGSLFQEDLELDIQIDNAVSQPGSYDLNGGRPELQQGPGVGSDTYAIGAENAWEVVVDAGSFSGYPCTAASSKEHHKQQAFDKANSVIGELFAQNDSLTITIQGQDYVVIPEMNKQSSLPFPGDEGGELDATNGEELQYFKPLGELWDVYGKIPLAGYNGNPGDDGERSVPSTIGGTETPILKENIPLNHTERNGIYEYQTSETGNILDYNTLVQKIVGVEHELHEDVCLLDDGTKPACEASAYPSGKNPTNKDYYLEGNAVMLQYTNWQAPVTQAGDLTFTHSGNEPDDNHDNSLDDNPTYRSVNPILLHNPTSAQFAWIADIPNSEMQDQRINGSDERISTHDSVNNASANPRLYIDYDFQLTIPDNATFNQYWGQQAGTSDRTGFPDLDFEKPGTLGKYYMDTKTVEQFPERFSVSPYLTQTAGPQYYLTTDGNNLSAIKTRNTWGIGKWVTAKYVKFPFDVYYYKNSGEQGGDAAGWYDAGTWIKLYDDMTIPSKATDPTEFNFHVGSNTKDINNGIIYVTSEAINSPDEAKGDPEALYLNGEQYINGTRNPKDEQLATYGTNYYGEATHSSTNQINIDVVGRIGNLAVSDTSDPAWNDVFWNTDSKGNIKVTEPVNKNYGLNYNMYETGLLGNASGFAPFDRFKTLDQWHGEMDPLYTLPVRTNPVSRGQSEQAIKLGYTIRGSLQTVGDYGFHGGSSMWIYPQNQLAGNFKTGKPSDPFKLVTSDPYAPGSKYMEYYDSKVNNTLHGQGGVLGKEYSPAYQHNLSASLADNRMKMSSWEKSNANYQKALQQGTQKKVISGNPSWIEIPLSLRTEIGSHFTQGRYGNINITPPHRNGNNGEGAKGDGNGSAFAGGDLVNGSCKCDGSYVNAHKWNFNYSLPQNTKVWFNNRTNKSGSPIFEAVTHDQYIITSMTFRTKVARSTFPGADDDWQTEIKAPALGDSQSYLIKGTQQIPDWDLTMYTKHGVENGGAPVPKITEIAGSDPTIGPKYPSNITPIGGDPSGGIVTTPDKWDPAQDGNIGNPMLDIVWWNYSKQATTDKDNIGTH